MSEFFGRDRLTVDQMFSVRNQAKEAGHVHYFSGNPCGNGHFSPRYVSTNQCVECVKIRNGKYYVPKPRKKLSEEEKRDRRKVYHQRHWQKYKERILERNKIWKENNKEKIQDYEKVRGRKRYGENPEKYIEKAKKYYHENREEVLRKKREYRAKNKDKIREQNRQYYLKKKKEREEGFH